MDKSRFDQHFLIDENILNRIITVSKITKEDIILEIGAGNGELTRRLADKAEKVIAIEADKSLEEKLKKIKKNVKLLIGNALELMDNQEYNKIVSNIPYSITEPLMKTLLKKKFDMAVLTIGKTFYNKIKSKHSKWSVIMPAFFNMKMQLIIDKACFRPRPRTDSVVISLEPKKIRSQFDRILKSFVLQDDKKTKNALVKTFKEEFRLTKFGAASCMINMELDRKILEKNVDYISNKEFLLLIEKIKEKIINNH